MAVSFKEDAPRVATVYVNEDGSRWRSFGSPILPDLQLLRRVWRRSGRPVATLEGIYVSGQPNGRRVVVDLTTGRSYKEALPGKYLQVLWFNPGWLAWTLEDLRKLSESGV